MRHDHPHDGPWLMFARSATKHRIPRADTRHAILHARHTGEQLARTVEEDDRIVFLGPDRSGRPLEVLGVIDSTRDDALLVIHSMPMRKQYQEIWDRKGAS